MANVTNLRNATIRNWQRATDELIHAHPLAEVGRPENPISAMAILLRHGSDPERIAAHLFDFARAEAMPTRQRMRLIFGDWVTESLVAAGRSVCSIGRAVMPGAAAAKWTYLVGCVIMGRIGSRDPRVAAVRAEIEKAIMMPAPYRRLWNLEEAGI